MGAAVFPSSGNKLDERVVGASPVVFKLARQVANEMGLAGAACTAESDIQRVVLFAPKLVANQIAEGP